MAVAVECEMKMCPVCVPTVLGLTQHLPLTIAHKDQPHARSPAHLHKRSDSFGRVHADHAVTFRPI
ncbi:MAG: hypothetical protein ACK55Z_20335, partial [bacterium]